MAQRSISMKVHQPLAMLAERIVQFEHFQPIDRQAQSQNLAGADMAMRLLRQRHVFVECSSAASQRSPSAPAAETPPASPYYPSARRILRRAPRPRCRRRIPTHGARHSDARSRRTATWFPAVLRRPQQWRATGRLHAQPDAIAAQVAGQYGPLNSKFSRRKRLVSARIERRDFGGKQVADAQTSARLPRRRADRAPRAARRFAECARIQQQHVGGHSKQVSRSRVANKTGRLVSSRTMRNMRCHSARRAGPIRGRLIHQQQLGFADQRTRDNATQALPGGLPPRAARRGILQRESFQRLFHAAVTLQSRQPAEREKQIFAQAHVRNNAHSRATYPQCRRRGGRFTPDAARTGSCRRG